MKFSEIFATELEKITSDEKKFSHYLFCAISMPVPAKTRRGQKKMAHNNSLVRENTGGVKSSKTNSSLIRFYALIINPSWLYCSAPNFGDLKLKERCENLENIFN